MSNSKIISERLAYPSSPLLKYLYKMPILLYRLGLGNLMGRLFMIMTTTGRKSGLPRRTAIEFHEREGRKYVLVGWTQSDWYRNLRKDPLLTIQTYRGVDHVCARVVESVDERREAWKVAENSPGLQMALKLSGVALTEDEFVSQTNRFVIVRFDSTDEPTPPALVADLRWVMPAALSVFLLLAIPPLMRRRKSKSVRGRGTDADGV